MDYKIYRDKKQDHLGKHKAMHRAARKPDATLWITEFQAYLSIVQQQDEQRQHTVAKLIEKFESHQHKEQFFKDISQTQKINRFCEASQKLLQDMDQTQPDTDLRISREFYETSMLRLQFLYGNRDYFLQLRVKKRSTSGVLQHFKRTTTISTRSLATSLRRIPVEDQSMANLRDKLCSSRRKTC